MWPFTRWTNLSRRSFVLEEMATFSDFEAQGIPLWETLAEIEVEFRRFRSFLYTH